MGSQLARSCCLVVIMMAGEAYAEADSPAKGVDLIKNPVAWFRWGTDLRLRNDSAENPNLQRGDPPGHTYSFERLRLREWSTFVIFQRLELTQRLTWEGRHYWAPASKPTWDRSDIVFDNLNARVILDFLTVVVGRQDIALGEGWLVSDGTPLDGPRTFFFDAVRATIKVSRVRSVVDLVYIDQRSSPDARLPPLFSKGQPLMEQNERGAIAYVSSELGDAVHVEGYGIYKRDRATQGKGDTGSVYTGGGNVAFDNGGHWIVRDEAAYQFGQRANQALFPNQDDQFSAWGNNGRLTFAVRDRMKNQVWGGYEILSGNDRNDVHNHQFDPLWGRWARYSELFPNEFDRPSDRGNIIRLNLGYQVAPTAGMQVQGNYHSIFAYASRFGGTAGYSNSGRFKGHLVTAFCKHELNRFASARLLLEYFKPGNYYASGDGPLATRLSAAGFVRGEITLTF